MADVARVAGKGGMCKPLDQLRPVRLVHVVATEAIRPFQGLSMVGIDNRLSFHVMTFHTPRAWIFQLVELGFKRSRFPGLVYDVTGIAPSIQGCMPTPLFRYIQTDCMTFQAEIFGLAARKGLQRVISVRRRMRVMTLDAAAR